MTGISAERTSPQVLSRSRRIPTTRRCRFGYGGIEKNWKITTISIPEAMAVQPTSVLECSVPPTSVNGHGLSILFSTIGLQSTRELARSSQPDITARSPLKFKRRPGPQKQPIPAVPRWIPLAAATPLLSQSMSARTENFRLKASTLLA